MVADVKPPEPTPPMPEAFVSQPAIPVRPADQKPVPEVYRHRSADNRQAQLQRFGGTPDTEAAVAAALDWLAAHQSGDGRWVAADFGSGRETKTLGQDRGGAVRTSRHGHHGACVVSVFGRQEKPITRASTGRMSSMPLEFLISSQASNGSLAGHAELFAQMYCHGMATLALAESWATSGDERLAEPVRRAIRYTLDCQHSGGGWRLSAAGSRRSEPVRLAIDGTQKRGSIRPDDS